MSEQLWPDERITEMRGVSGLTDGQIMRQMRDEMQAKIDELEEVVAKQARAIDRQVEYILAKAVSS